MDPDLKITWLTNELANFCLHSPGTIPSVLEGRRPGSDIANTSRRSSDITWLKQWAIKETSFVLKNVISDECWEMFSLEKPDIPSEEASLFDIDGTHDYDPALLVVFSHFNKSCGDNILRCLHYGSQYWSTAISGPEWICALVTCVKVHLQVLAKSKKSITAEKFTGAVSNSSALFRTLTSQSPSKVVAAFQKTQQESAYQWIKCFLARPVLKIFSRDPQFDKLMKCLNQNRKITNAKTFQMHADKFAETIGIKESPDNNSGKKVVRLAAFAMHLAQFNELERRLEERRKSGEPAQDDVVYNLLEEILTRWALAVNGNKPLKSLPNILQREDPPIMNVDWLMRVSDTEWWLTQKTVEEYRTTHFGMEMKACLTEGVAGEKKSKKSKTTTNEKRKMGTEAVAGEKKSKKSAGDKKSKKSKKRKTDEKEAQQLVEKDGQNRGGKKGKHTAKKACGPTEKGQVDEKEAQLDEKDGKKRGGKKGKRTAKKAGGPTEKGQVDEKEARLGEKDGQNRGGNKEKRTAKKAGRPTKKGQVNEKEVQLDEKDDGQNRGGKKGKHTTTKAIVEKIQEGKEECQSDKKDDGLNGGGKKRERTATKKDGLDRGGKKGERTAKKKDGPDRGGKKGERTAKKVVRRRNTSGTGEAHTPDQAGTKTIRKSPRLQKPASSQSQSKPGETQRQLFSN